MNKKLFFIIVSIGLFFSCEDPDTECTRCHSIKEDIASGEILERKDIGIKCGHEIDSVLSIPPASLGDDYRFYYRCD